MSASLGRLVIYSRKIPEMIEFYCLHFGFERLQIEGDRLVELRAPSTGLSILLPPATKGQKEGQVLVKLVFDVQDVESFCEHAKQNGLQFGTIHQADGYEFANTKDPSKNSISVSSRIFANPK